MLSVCPSGFLSTQGTRATMRSYHELAWGVLVYFKSFCHQLKWPLCPPIICWGLDLSKEHIMVGPQEDVALLTSDTILDDVKAACILPALHWGYEVRQTPKIRFCHMPWLTHETTIQNLRALPRAWYLSHLCGFILNLCTAAGCSTPKVAWCVSSSIINNSIALSGFQPKSSTYLKYP